ncbi:MAG TPA: M6 family metalloprotease domain-containing protein [Verrucomicrobiae bacterium]
MKQSDRASKKKVGTTGQSVLRHSTLLLATAVLVAWTSAQASPFRNLRLPFTQPDGTRIEITGSGDEFYAVFETQDGFTVVFDQGLRAYCFGQITGDGQLVSTGRQVHLSDPAALGLVKHLRMPRSARKQQVAERRQRWESGTEVDKRWESIKAARRSYDAAIKEGLQLAPPSFTTTGLRLGLTLLIDFDDDPATVPQAEIINFCNGDAYSGFGNNGSVKKYFQDNSNGVLTYSNVVTVYVRIPNSLHSKSWYNDTSLDSGSQGNLLVRDALTILKALPNYTTEILPRLQNLTVDENNRVVACNVFFAGGNSGVWSKGLWPHSWSLREVGAQELSPGGKKVYRYQITNIGTSLELGTFCHENGHMLCGYPDIYDYDYDSEGGAGVFCLMNSGGHGNNPTQVCAYLKRASGWVTTTELDTSSSLTATLTAAAAAGANFNHFYRFQKPGVPTEYFLIECRENSGRDANLSASGIAIWHIDEEGDKNDQRMAPNTAHQNYEVTLVQADNQWDFELNANDGDAMDLYYSGNAAAAYSNEFSDTSSPNAHWWDGSESGVAFHSFTAPATTMSFQVGHAPAAPQIVTQPQSQTAIAGSAVTFTVTAVGTPVLAYQWYFNGAPIAGANARSCTVQSATDADQGNYRVRVSNGIGSADSQTATLTVVQGVSLAAALDTAGLVWTTGGNAPWTGQLVTTHDGTDAAQSMTISHNEESWLETTIANGPGLLSFWWKVSSEGGWDYLEFLIDGVVQSERLSGEVDWECMNYNIPAGNHVVRWRYSKDEAVSAGEDRGWVDQVSFVPEGPIVPLGEALDGPDLTWTTGGTAPWSGQTGITHDRLDAGQSGMISDSQDTWMQTTMTTGPGTLTFWWKVSSEPGYDFLEFYLDDVLQSGRIAGEVDWTQQTYSLNAGSHTLRWRYAKDQAVSAGQDRAWVDQVAFVPATTQPPVLASPRYLAGGVFQCDITGSRDSTYVVFGSTDLKTWTPLVTNTAPFTFTDDRAAQFPFRLYRARSNP